MPNEAKFSPLPPQSQLVEAKGILWMLAGVLFLAVTYRYKGFEVMPDVAGYIFMAVGLKQLEGHAPKLRRARILAIIGAAVSLPSIYASGMMSLLTQGLWDYVDTLVLMPLLIAFGLVLARNVIYGVIDLAQRVGEREKLAAWGRKLFILLLVTRVAAALSLWIGVPPLPGYVAFAFWAAGVAGELCYSLYLWQAYVSLDGAVIEPAS